MPTCDKILCTAIYLRVCKKACKINSFTYIRLTLYLNKNSNTKEKFILKTFWDVTPYNLVQMYTQESFLFK